MSLLGARHAPELVETGTDPVVTPSDVKEKNSKRAPIYYLIFLGTPHQVNLLIPGEFLPQKTSHQGSIHM